MERRAISVSGVVQGVGFRPFVYGLACRLRLDGFVKNQMGDVLIEIEGPGPQIDQFMHELRTHPPPLARIGSIESRRQKTLGRSGFEIHESEAGHSAAICICPDIATCPDCLAEMFDPADRRYRYPFINCTNCGPRLTIIRGAPYDRHRTTMAGFPMCAACRREYENPLDRRFHAQPIACPVCGPRLRVVDANGTALLSEDPMSATVSALREGRIVAIKGLGGFHLACDARNEAAVQSLRKRKHRDEKPFAVMARDARKAQEFCLVGPGELAVLESAPRPIVLLAKRIEQSLAPNVAPGNPRIGVMLPYTPLHHLLLQDLGDVPLVMTSGNRSDEPIAYEDADALTRLAGIADLLLMHDRPIHVRCDDSVVHVAGRQASPIRRSRGYAPTPMKLPRECPEPMLAVGGQLKSTFALGRDGEAILSHHLGDLDDFEAFRAFERDIGLYQELFAIEPGVIVHDLHPDYSSTRWARKQQESRGIRCVGVQHHHAHIAACMAEHELDERVIGVSFDGTGYGSDGAIWGGEFLVCDYAGFERAAHLRYVPMPGGEKAIREPWRMALSHLVDAGADCEIYRNRIGDLPWQTCRRMLEQRFHSPRTSSAGRLFDAVASLAGIRDVVSYEAQAAMEMEWLAARTRRDGAYPFEINRSQPTAIIDTRPLIRAAAGDARSGVAAALIARRFHSTMVDLVAATVREIRKCANLDVVALSGGVLLNTVLSEELTQRLCDEGFRVYRHRIVPPSDGGLCLGQLAVGIARLSAEPGGIGCA